jgi:Right handed beta helix region
LLPRAPLFAQENVTRLFVDPAAAIDHADGSQNHPFATIEDARDHVRALKNASRLSDGGVIVTILPGVVSVDKTIAFDARDSGEPGQPIVYRAAAGFRLVGGLIMTSPKLERVTDPAVLARFPTQDARNHVRRLNLTSASDRTGVPDLAGPVHRGMGTAKVSVGSELIWDGVVLTRARWPNVDGPDHGFARVTELIDAGSVPRNRAPDVAPNQKETGEPKGGSFRLDDERVKRWATANDVWALGYWRWDWAEEQLPIEQIDPSTGTISLGLPHRYGLKQGASFYVTNLLEELDAPGEYFIDRSTAILYMWPPSDQPPHKIIVTTMARPVISITGAHDLSFEGLTIEGTRGPAIVATGVRDVHVRGGTIRNIGADAIQFSGTNNIIAANNLADIGGTGIIASGGDRATLSSADNRIIENHIQRFGRVYRTYNPGIRLSGVGQYVANNEIHDAPHSALMFRGNDHLIELNEIYDVLNETGDAGAIYCGRDWTLHGTVIRYNLFHHISGSDARYQNAVYLDDMASGIRVVGNIMYKCNWGMLVGGGRDVLVRGNLFIDCRKAMSFDARGVGWMAKNIADPATSTLHKNLAAVPYTQPPWSERFPTLSTYLTDRFGRPVGSAVVGNALVRTPLGRIDDRENVAVDANTQLADDWRLIEDDPATPLGLHLNTDRIVVQTPTGPVTIPLSRIGRGTEAR